MIVLLTVHAGSDGCYRLIIVSRDYRHHGFAQFVVLVMFMPKIWSYMSNFSVLGIVSHYHHKRKCVVVAKDLAIYNCLQDYLQALYELA